MNTGKLPKEVVESVRELIFERDLKKLNVTLSFRNSRKSNELETEIKLKIFEDFISFLKRNNIYESTENHVHLLFELENSSSYTKDSIRPDELKHEIIKRIDHLLGIYTIVFRYWVIVENNKILGIHRNTNLELLDLFGSYKTRKKKRKKKIDDKRKKRISNLKPILDEKLPENYIESISSSKSSKSKENIGKIWIIEENDETYESELIKKQKRDWPDLNRG